MTTPPNNLLARSLNALKWSYVGVVFRIVLQLVAQIAIARLIGPAAFGTASAAIFVMAIANIVVELGLGSSLIQKPKISSDDIRFVLRRIVLACALVGTALLFSAPYIGTFWGDDNVAPLLRALVIATIAQASGIVALALLRRELEFKWIQISQITGYFIGFFVTGIGVAALDGGAWSLVYAWITQNVCTSLMLFWRARHSVNIFGSTTTADPSIQAYGLRILFTNFANWTIENIDNFMVGRAFGTYALGAYTVSYNLVRTPTNHLVTSIQQVLFPASARSSGQSDSHGLTYLTVVWAVALIAFPIFFGVAAIADTVVDALYGSKWSMAGAILLPLAVGMPFHAVMAVGGPMLWGRGEAAKEMQVQFVVAPVLVLVLFFMTNMTPVAMAWGVVGVYIFRAIWIQSKVATALGISIKSVMSAIGPGALVGIALAVVLWSANGFWETLALTSFNRLLLAILAGLFFVALIVTSVKKLLPSEIGSGLRKQTGLPPRLLRALGVQ